MLFDQLLQRVQQRFNDYARSRRPGTVLSEEALVEAAELWRAGQPANPRHLSPDDSQRLAVAHHALGWLHVLRCDALPVGPDYLSEMARAVVYIAPLAHDPTTIPEPLQVLLGPTADADRQAKEAADLLRLALTTADPTLLDATIVLLTASTAATPDDHPDRAGRLSNLGAAYEVRFGSGGVLEDLEQAIEFGVRAVAATPHDHPDRAGRLSNLGKAYRTRFVRGGVLDDLDQAIELGAQAVAATPHNHPALAMFQSNLSDAYRVRFVRGGVLDDLDQAIELGVRAVAATPHDHPERAGRLASLGNAYGVRFERGGVLTDSDEAIDVIARAVAATPHGHPERATHLTNLGVAYGVRFERSGMLDDLAQAIEIGVQAVAATPHNHPARALRMSNLGLAHQTRFTRSGALDDLEQAIELGAQAVAATPHDHPDRAAMLSNLGLAYRLRFERSGMLDDLEQAIEIGVQAVAATPHDHPERAALLSNLGVAYRARFEHGGVLEDLDQAIEFGAQAVAATPHDHPDRPKWLSGLGLAYRARFERSGVLDDLEQAIEIGVQAVAATPHDHPDRAGKLSNLGLAYRARFEHGGGLDDLDQAIEIGVQAVAATPHDHPDRAGIRSNLGVAYEMRFERGGALDDLDQAIEHGVQAVAAIPHDHPDRAACLINLGAAYQTRWDVTGQGIDQETTRTLAEQVAAAQTASPVYRVRAGKVVGSLAHEMGEHTIAVELLDAAVRVLPSVAPREAGWSDQEHRLGEHRGLVGEAVAAHCAINDPVGAVEAAELGRGVLLAAQLDSRSDLTDLDHAHAELAAEFRRVRAQLNTAPIPPPIDRIDQIEPRKRLWAEHDQLLDQIRQQPGFDRFLLPPRLADLRPATGDTVILVNTGRRRSDAIIITAGADPVPVPLDATFADVVSHAHTWLEVIQDASPVGILRRQRVVPEILGWLWDAIVKQALEAVPGTSTLPRVWWLPTGPLGLFPLHAAGPLNGPGALDTVISSYTPTLRALAHTRTRPAATVRRQLTVALHHTPGLPDLPGTVAEATELHAHHPDTRLLLDEHATISRVLAALPEATWAHFACHASADPTVPSRGGFALHDATLAIPEISQLQLGHAELAYLSACSTANRGLRLPDESLHLASAFQLAGFRHVIASLWPLDDRIAATAAAAIYRHLSDTPTAEHAATALHHVTHRLRDKHPDRPDLWAALIHSGP